jgi:WNK lysine deficient protein kinase
MIACCLTLSVRVYSTEIISSGTLRQYIHRMQSSGVKLKVIKRWCVQILQALEYLHGHDPPVSRM